jgi:hypothetical protein
VKARPRRFVHARQYAARHSRQRASSPSGEAARRWKAARGFRARHARQRFVRRGWRRSARSTRIRPGPPPAHSRMSARPTRCRTGRTGGSARRARSGTPGSSARVSPAAHRSARRPARRFVKSGSDAAEVALRPNQLHAQSTQKRVCLPTCRSVLRLVAGVRTTFAFTTIPHSSSEGAAHSVARPAASRRFVSALRRRPRSGKTVRNHMPPEASRSRCCTLRQQDTNRPDTRSH